MPTNVVDSSIKARIQRDAVGRVPSDWTIRSVAELVQEGVLDRIQDGNHGESHPVSTDYVPSGVPFLMSGNIRNGRVEVSRCKFLREEQAKSLRVGHARRGDVLLTHKGNDLGRTAILHDADWAILTPQITYYRVKERTRLLPDFLMYLFESPQFQHQFKRDCHQSTRPFVSISNQQRLYLPIPPFEEQRMIVRILGSLDDKINLNRRMNETLEAMARAIFKSWFVDFDPVRAKIEGHKPVGMDSSTARMLPTAFRKTSIGEIPIGWCEGTIGEIADNPRCGVRPEEIDPSTPYIGLEHMPRRCMALAAWGQAEELESGKFRFKKGEILFGKLRPYFHKVGVAVVDGICSTDILVVTPQKSDWFGFLLGHISSVEFVNHTDAASSGTKMPRTNWNDMARYRVALPPESLARSYSQLVQPFIERIGVNILESRTLVALRDALLPKLLSGEIRVKEAEKLVGAKVP